MDLIIHVDDNTPSEEYDVGRRTIEVVNSRTLETKQNSWEEQSRERRKESSGPLEHRMQKIIERQGLDCTKRSCYTWCEA